jgi:hypothetical protein
VWGVQSIGPGRITIRLVAKTKPLEQWRITRLLRERIKTELDREGGRCSVADAVDRRQPGGWRRIISFACPLKRGRSGLGG